MLAAAALRAFLVFRASPLFDLVRLLLLIWLLAYIGDLLLARQRTIVSVVPIAFQLGSTLALLLLTRADFFMFLFTIPCMGATQQFHTREIAALVGLTTLVALLSLVPSHGILFAFGMATVYCGGTILLVAYIRSTLRASRIDAEQHKLAVEVQQANNRLEATARRLEQLAAERERQRLARELHDSVTQTLYSMTLTTQSALLLLDRTPSQVRLQLERLAELTQSALSEMQVLISKLAPERNAEGGLVAYLKRHLEERRRLEGLSVRLEIDGNQALLPVEEAGLFRIAQEALNNVVKHAQISQGVLRLHLKEPFWMEIEDRGVGFDPQCVRVDGGIGLVGMQERAAEIGWKFRLESSPGSGTCIRVRKEPEEGGNREPHGH